MSKQTIKQEDKKIREFFNSCKSYIPDDGFSAGVVERLPGRGNIFAQLIIALSAVAGFVLAVSVYGVKVLLGQVYELVLFIGNLQVPSYSFVLVYMAAVLSVCIIGFAIYKADKI